MDFADGIFALATFSYSGIDAVGLEGRRAIMLEVNRVLRPRGYSVFSTLNPKWRGVAAALAKLGSCSTGAGLQPLRLLRAVAKLLLSGAQSGRAWRAGDAITGMWQSAAWRRIISRW